MKCQIFHLEIKIQGYLYIFTKNQMEPTHWLKYNSKTRMVDCRNCRVAVYLFICQVTSVSTLFAKR